MHQRNKKFTRTQQQVSSKQATYFGTRSLDPGPWSWLLSLVSGPWSRLWSLVPGPWSLVPFSILHFPFSMFHVPLVLLVFSCFFVEPAGTGAGKNRFSGAWYAVSSPPSSWSQSLALRLWPDVLHPLHHRHCVQGGAPHARGPHVRMPARAVLAMIARRTPLRTPTSVGSVRGVI